MERRFKLSIDVKEYLGFMFVFADRIMNRRESPSACFVVSSYGGLLVSLAGCFLSRERVLIFRFSSNRSENAQNSISLLITEI